MNWRNKLRKQCIDEMLDEYEQRIDELEKDNKLFRDIVLRRNSEICELNKQMKQFLNGDLSVDEYKEKIADRFWTANKEAV